jgi:hypothetical protein
MALPNDNMPAKKGLDVMIAIGTKKGLGMKDNANGNYKDSMNAQDNTEAADQSEDNSEGDMNMCEHCNKEMVCSGCNQPESDCSCE